ncbi:MAG: DUF5131 family protein [Lachnospiraceae bacterium]|nr:DUF5131 family protein [Lachnospiraceae bacterium]
MDIDDKTWNPWHGCHKCSEGCQNCYAYFLDKRYGRDTNEVVKNKSNFNFPVKKDRAGQYKLESGSFVRVCMTSDFFLEEADEWRKEAWDYIRQRPDVTFSLLTKRAQRIRECLPDDWADGWDNVTFSVSCENQKRLDERIPYLLELPSKHKWVSLKPFIGEIDIEEYLATEQIESVLAGGENYLGSRPLHYEWVKKVHDACVKYNVQLIFGQTGNIFIKDGKEYKIHNRTEQMVQALRSGLHYPPKDIEAEIDAIYARKATMKEIMENKKSKTKNKSYC